jgi:hypothetical protein
MLHTEAGFKSLVDLLFCDHEGLQMYAAAALYNLAEHRTYFYTPLRKLTLFIS